MFSNFVIFHELISSTEFILIFILCISFALFIFKALGTVTGIINGSGSVTAALGQLAIPILYQMGIKDGVGYRYVWFFLIFCTAVGTSLLSPRIYKELYPRPAAPLATTRGQYTSISGAEKA